MDKWTHERSHISSPNFIHRYILGYFRTLKIFKVNGQIIRSPGQNKSKFEIAVTSSISKLNVDHKLEIQGMLLSI